MEFGNILELLSSQLLIDFFDEITNFLLHFFKSSNNICRPKYRDIRFRSSIFDSCNNENSDAILLGSHSSYHDFHFTNSKS